MIKKTYIKPQMKVTEIDERDLIATSMGLNDEDPEEGRRQW